MTTIRMFDREDKHYFPLDTYIYPHGWIQIRFYPEEEFPFCVKVGDEDEENQLGLKSGGYHAVKTLFRATTKAIEFLFVEE